MYFPLELQDLTNILISSVTKLYPYHLPIFTVWFRHELKSGCFTSMLLCRSYSRFSFNSNSENPLKPSDFKLGSQQCLIINFEAFNNTFLSSAGLLFFFPWEPLLGWKTSPSQITFKILITSLSKSVSFFFFSATHIGCFFLWLYQLS